MTQNWVKESARLRYDKTLKFTTIFTVTMLGILTGIVTQHDENISITILRSQNRDVLFIGVIFALIIGLFFSLWKLRMIEKLLSDDSPPEINSKVKRPSIGVKEYFKALFNSLSSSIEGLQPVMLIVVGMIFSIALALSSTPEVSTTGIVIAATVALSIVVAIFTMYLRYNKY